MDIFCDVYRLLFLILLVVLQIYMPHESYALYRPSKTHEPLQCMSRAYHNRCENGWIYFDKRCFRKLEWSEHDCTIFHSDAEPLDGDDLVEDGWIHYSIIRHNVYDEVEAPSWLMRMSKYDACKVCYYNTN